MINEITNFVSGSSEYLMHTRTEVDYFVDKRRTRTENRKIKNLIESK